MISYRKTKQGTWVAYGPAAEVRPGQVTVTKRDGTAKAETVERVGKTFQVDGTAMVYGYLAARPAARTPGTRSTAHYSHTDHQECAECGSAPGRYRRRDSSGIAGLVCYRCNRYPDYQLSFC